MSNGIQAAFVLGFGARLLTLAYRFMAVPIGFALLGQESYGVWLLVISLAGWIGFADLGIPLALQRLLVEASVVGDRARGVTVLVFGIRFLLAVALFISFALIVAASGTPLASVFNLSCEVGSDFTFLIIVVGSLMAFAVPLRLAHIACYSWGKPQWSAATDVLTVGANFLVLMALWYFAVGSLRGFVLGIQLSTIAVAVTFAVWTLGRFGIPARSLLRRSGASGDQKRGILKSAAWYLFNFIGEGLVLQSDTILISIMLGPTEIPRFAIPMIAIMQFLQFQNAFLRPTMAEMARLKSGREFFKLRALIGKISLLSLGLSIAGALLLITCGDYCIRWWTHGAVGLPLVMGVGIAAYLCSLSVANVLSAFASAVDIMRERFWGLLLFGGLKCAVVVYALGHDQLDRLPLYFFLVALCTDLPWLGYLYYKHTNGSCR